MRQILVCAVLALAACATPSEDGVLDGFEGRWTGTGTFRGMPSSVEANFVRTGENEWTLDLDIVANQSSENAISFWGRGRYFADDGTLTGGAWTDSTGSSYAILPRLDRGDLIVDWGPEAPVRGRSEYRLLADGDLQIDDFAPNAQGESRQFATAVLDRIR